MIPNYMYLAFDLHINCLNIGFYGVLLWRESG